MPRRRAVVLAFACSTSRDCSATVTAAWLTARGRAAIAPSSPLRIRTRRSRRRARTPNANSRPIRTAPVPARAATFAIGPPARRSSRNTPMLAQPGVQRSAVVASGDLLALRLARGRARRLVSLAHGMSSGSWVCARVHRVINGTYARSACLGRIAVFHAVRRPLSFWRSDANKNDHDRRIPSQASGARAGAGSGS